MTAIYTTSGHCVKGYSSANNEFWPACSSGVALEYEPANISAHAGAVLHVTGGGGGGGGGEHQQAANHVASQYAVFNGRGGAPCNWLEEQYDPSKKAAL